jgi:hypothetical protein
MRAARLGEVVGGRIQIVLRPFPHPTGSFLRGSRLFLASLSVLDCRVHPSRCGGQLALAATLGCRGRARVPFTRSNGVKVHTIPIWSGRTDNTDRALRMSACGRTNGDAR